jgi:hypothetical protein
MIKRRDVVLALSAFGAAPYVEAQQPSAGKPKRIGLISDVRAKLPATELPGWKAFWSALGVGCDRLLRAARAQRDRHRPVRGD